MNLRSIRATRPMSFSTASATGDPGDTLRVREIYLGPVEDRGPIRVPVWSRGGQNQDSIRPGHLARLLDVR